MAHSRIPKIFTDRNEFLQFKKSIPKSSTLSDLKKAFEKAVNKSVQEIKKSAVLFSGGVDSSMIAKAVGKKIPKTVLYTVGMKNSKDILEAKSAAEKLDLKLRTVLVSEEDLPDYLKKVKQTLKTHNFLQLQIAVPIYIVLEKIKKDNLKFVFCGQGADELFCGYDKFRKILEEKGYAAVQEEIVSKMENMYERNLKRDFAIAEHFGLELKAPFLEPDFMRIALAVPPEQKISSPEDMKRKLILRKLALQYGIPEEIAYRRKSAIQYGSGISKKLKELEKSYPTS